MKTAYESPADILLHLPAQTWMFFNRQEVIQRMEAWQRAAVGPAFRRPLEIRGLGTPDGDLYLALPALPENWRSFADASQVPLEDRDKIRLLIGLCEALKILHMNGFVMGFLAPEHLHFDPETLDVRIDIQPYPSTTAFVNHLLSDYPYILFSGYSRTPNMPRLADYYGVGLLVQWLFAGRLPDEPRAVVDGLPDFVRPLCEKLMCRTNEFLFADEIADSFRETICEPPQHRDGPVGPSSGACLHPMAPLISKRDQEKLRAFLVHEGTGVLGIVSENEMARHDVVRQHITDVFERDLFITIACRNFPFATLRELIDRTMSVAHTIYPELGGRLRTLSRKLDRLLRKHYVGDDIIHLMDEWLITMYEELRPLFQHQSVYYMFEGAEEFDVDSQRVFLHFWQTHGHRFDSLHALYSGRATPVLFQNTVETLHEIGGTDSEPYRGLLISMLGRAEEPVLADLTAWLVGQEADVTHLPMLLDTLIRKGELVLTRQGWVFPAGVRPDLNLYDAACLIAERTEQLQPEDRDWLCVWACLPSQIRAGWISYASGLDFEQMYVRLRRLAQVGLIKVYHENSVFVPPQVASHLLNGLPDEKRRACHRRALELLHAYRPNHLPPLIALARQSGDTELEYMYLIHYFRQVRSMLSYARRRTLLEDILRLQERLGRKCLYFPRMLAKTYYRLNLFQEAKRVALSLYEQTNQPKDLYFSRQVLLVMGDLDVAESRRHAIEQLADPGLSLAVRVYAMTFIFKTGILLPLHCDVVKMLDAFYTEQVHPNRSQLSTRQFCEVTIAYTIMLFQNMAEKESAATVLLEMVESILENSEHLDLMPLLFEAYNFHSNISLARHYTQRNLEISRRSGFKGREQMCHINAMETSLFQGDLPSYRYHKEQATVVDEFHRKDFKEQYLLHQLFRACEWEDRDAFAAVEEQLREQGMSAYTESYWQLFRRYAAFRRGEALPPRQERKEEGQLSFFTAALYEAQAGNLDKACGLFLQSILANGYSITAGWSYREMILLLLKQGVAEAGEWLARFEHYLKTYRNDLFWPDFYRLSAEWSCERDAQRRILFLRRAENAYQLVEKEGWRAEMAGRLSRAVEPAYLPEGSPLLDDPLARKLLDDRVSFLHQSLDLLVIIQLSEQVTESLELSTTIHKLIDALFEYFPVTQAAVSYHLSHRQDKTVYSASGVIHDDMLLKWDLVDKNSILFDLYQAGGQAITLTLVAQEMDETKRRHMEHFLSFIKPHIANAIHYLEMMTDTLTGFYQRRYFNERLKQELEISQRNGLDLSLIMIDIDNFRLINEHGHQEGDQVLREISDMIRSILRKNDIPGRYGGEELLLILPKTDGHNAWKVACKIREQIEEEYAQGRPYKVTVSVGVSSLKLCGATSIDDLIFYADSAEITAKTTGKNKVVAAWDNKKGSSH